MVFPTTELSLRPRAIPRIPPPSGSDFLVACQDQARKVLGFSQLRAGQLRALEYIGNRKDTIIVMPTGSGKSACYLLPALIRPGLTLVISPLIALMRDQVLKMHTQGIAGAAIDSLQSREEKASLMEQVARGSIQVLLVSPERLMQQGFRNWLARTPLNLVAVDEAHCISYWGFHFRPEFRHIGKYLEDFAPVQKIALTATATAKVRSDISACLHMANPAQVVESHARENLRLKVVHAPTRIAQDEGLVAACSKAKGQGIIYALTRKRVIEISQLLKNRGLGSLPYHAGLAPEERESHQAQFVSGKVPVVVATNAFGLGIDKSDLRFVHHAGIPASIEAYIQEVGRAGRDGRSSSCSLLYSRSDYHLHRFMLSKSFPDVVFLKEIYNLASQYLARYREEREHLLLRLLLKNSRYELGEIRLGFEFLLREGLLVRLPNYSSLGESKEPWIATLLSPEEVAKLWREYPGRKEHRLRMLSMMFEYVTSKRDRGLFLDAYFA